MRTDLARAVQLSVPLSKGRHKVPNSRLGLCQVRLCAHVGQKFLGQSFTTYNSMPARRQALESGQVVSWHKAKNMAVWKSYGNAKEGKNAILRASKIFMMSYISYSLPSGNSMGFAKIFPICNPAM